MRLAIQTPVRVRFAKIPQRTGKNDSRSRRQPRDRLYQSSLPGGSNSCSLHWTLSLLPGAARGAEPPYSVPAADVRTHLDDVTRIIGRQSMDNYNLLIHKDSCN